MDKKSKILLIIFSLLLIGSVAFTIYKYGIEKDYLIVGQSSCDPITESCFFIPCVEGDGTCNPADIQYFKKIERKAFNVELCDPAVVGCDPLACFKNEKDCSTTYCSTDTLDDGEECSTSTQ